MQSPSLWFGFAGLIPDCTKSCSYVSLNRDSVCNISEMSGAFTWTDFTHTDRGEVSHRFSCTRNESETV